MFIERIQVEEGFLNGLDISLKAGLNVIIGARGTGKTSLIELIRFCLNVSASTPDANKKSNEHALSILGSGQVTVTLNNNGQKIQVTRTCSDPLPRSDGIYLRPLIFSQKEVETIGLEASGRLKLIDAFITNSGIDIDQENKTKSEISSYTTEITKKRREIDELDAIVRELPTVEKELSLIVSSEQGLASRSVFLNGKTTQLNNISSQLSELSVLEENTKRAKIEIEEWYKGIYDCYLVQLSEFESNNTSLTPHRETINKSKESLKNILIDIYAVIQKLESTSGETSGKKIAYEAQSRELRKEVETLESGSGEILRKGQELREKKAKITSYEEVLRLKKVELLSLINKRNECLERLELLRETKFNKRFSTCKSLNTHLSPNINTSILKNAQYHNFTSYLIDILKGSGIKYNEIAPAIAGTLSPRALLEAVDNFDVELVTQAANISSDRATRLLAHLRECDLSSLGAVVIDDDVKLQLLDGNDFKDLGLLSTGQRCTVVLPIILSHNERILIVDQPEDHIDNAFITSTLIKSISNRLPENQIIFSTHNPNIPVLGNADYVVQFGSDGRNGYVLTEGELDASNVVSAITSVMEGGAAAFEHRSSFYNKHKK